ncbi:MAG: hypothetical protein ACRC9H_15105, partial [Aeromonas veronii]
AVGPDAIKEMRLTADLALRATKETANSVGRSMSAMVVTERHLWLNLTEINKEDKSFLLNAPLNPFSLFGGAVTPVTDRFLKAKEQSAVLQQFLPQGTQVSPAAEREQQKPVTSSLHRQQQKVSVAIHAPPPRSGNMGCLSQARAPRSKTDPRTVSATEGSSPKSS